MTDNKRKIQGILILLNPDNTISINRPLTFAIGLQETVMYQALLRKYISYEKNNTLLPGGWFYSTGYDLEESTSFSTKVQRRLADNLCKYNLIEKKLAGMPSKTHYKINLDIEIVEELINKGQELIDTKKNKKAKISTLKAIDNHSLDQWDKQVSTSGMNKYQPTGQTSFDQRDKQVSTNGTNKFRPTGQISFDQWDEQVSTDGINMNSPKGKTSFDEKAYKTKDNKTKEETKDNKHSFLSIHYETKNGIEKDEYKMNELKAQNIIEYDSLVNQLPEYTDFINSIVQIMVVILSTKDSNITFGKQTYETNLFKIRLNSLCAEMIEDIIDGFNSLPNKVKNPVSYLAKMLWQEPLQYAIKVADEIKDVGS